MQNISHFLIEKLLTPIAFALPLSCIFSMRAQVSLKIGVS